MSRQIINRILLVLFVVVIFGMGVYYVKQEHKIAQLEQEYEELLMREEKVKYMINEYSILVDSVNSRNYIIRIARDMFGWVFDNETIYKKPVANPEPSNGADTVIEDSVKGESGNNT